MARDFLEDRISVEIGYGSSFRESYSVVNTEDVSRNSYGKLNDPRPLARCEYIYQNRSHQFTLMQVVDLFHRSGGTFGGFRVKNYGNYSTNQYQKPPTALDQVLRKTTNPNVFQLVQWYGPPVETSRRRLIKKPVPGSVKIAKNGVVMSSGVSVDNTSGLVTFTAAPEISDTLTGGCYFDFPMRFETDLDGIDFTDLNMLSLSVSLVELLNP